MRTRGREDNAEDVGSYVKRTMMVMVLGLAALGGTACEESTPTSVDPDLQPTHPASAEVHLAWEEFGSNLRVYGGYGAVADIGVGLVAHGFGGVLEARTLVRFAELATTVTVTDTTGTSTTDGSLTLIGGRVVATVDTASAVADGPVTLQLGAVSQGWDRFSASWTMAVDTTGDAVAWAEPGAGPVAEVTTAVWDPAVPGDTVVFALDSAQVEIWRDTSVVNQGALVGILTEGVRLDLTEVVLRATVRPSVRPDTLVDITGSQEDLTFLFTPEPDAPQDEIRVGGAPAWRTALDIEIPDLLTGPPSLCASLACPLKLTPARVNYAAIVLTSRRTPSAFQPSDSLDVDVRVVYDRARMPKSPLGSSLVSPYGKRVAPELFSTAEGTEVEIPITGYVRSVLQGDSVSGYPPPGSLALLSMFEPQSFTFLSFFGPGTPDAPMLKLVVTAGGSVELP